MRLAVEAEAADARRLTCAIAMVLAAGAAMKLMLLAGPLGSDDLRYFDFAAKLASLQSFEQLDHAASRIAFLALVGVPGALAGSIMVSGVVSVVLAVLTELIVVLFLLRRQGATSALLAAIFLSLNGVVVAYAGTFLPDTLLALLFLLGSLLCMRILECEGVGDAATLACGAFIGLAYSTKDTGILLLPCVLFALLFFGSNLPRLRRLRASALVLAGFVAVWLIECFVLWWLSGRFLYRYEALSGVHNVMMPTAGSVREFVARGFWNAYEVIIEWQLLLFPSLLALLVGVGLARRGGGQSMLAVTIGFCFAFLLFGSSSFTRLVNLPFQERYLQPLLPLLAIAVALLLRLEKSRLVTRAAVLTAFSVASLTSVAAGLGRDGERFFEGYLARAALAIRSMEGPGWSPVFVDERTRKGLEHLLDHATLARVSPLPAMDSQLPAGTYLIHPAHPCPRMEIRCNSLQGSVVVLRIGRPSDDWLSALRPKERPALVRQVRK